MARVLYSRKAIKGLRKMPAQVANQFRTAFEQVGNNEGHWDTRRLEGREGYRLRIGRYRAIYTIDGEQVTVIVLDAGPRGDIYK